MTHIEKFPYMITTIGHTEEFGDEIQFTFKMDTGPDMVSAVRGMYLIQINKHNDVIIPRFATKETMEKMIEIEKNFKLRI